MTNTSEAVKALNLLIKSGDRVIIAWSLNGRSDKSEPMAAEYALPLVEVLEDSGAQCTVFRSEWHLV